MRASTLYNLLAPVYARLAPLLFERVSSRAAQRVGAGAPANVLEVGAGPGRLLAELHDRVKDMVVGVEISGAMIGHARRRLNGKPNARLVRADGLTMPFRDGVYDGVVCVFFLDVLDDAEIHGALSEMTRVLAPGGRIVIASVHFTSSAVEQGWMVAFKVFPELVGRVRPVDIDDQLEAAGLRILKAEEIPEFTGVRLLTLVKVVG